MVDLSSNFQGDSTSFWAVAGTGAGFSALCSILGRQMRHSW